MAGSHHSGSASRRPSVSPATSARTRQKRTKGSDDASAQVQSTSVHPPFVLPDDDEIPEDLDAQNALLDYLNETDDHPRTPERAVTEELDVDSADRGRSGPLGFTFNGNTRIASLPVGFNPRDVLAMQAGESKSRKRLDLVREDLGRGLTALSETQKLFQGCYDGLDVVGSFMDTNEALVQLQRARRSFSDESKLRAEAEARLAASEARRAEVEAGRAAAEEALKKERSERAVEQTKHKSLMAKAIQSIRELKKKKAPASSSRSKE